MNRKRYIHGFLVGFLFCVGCYGQTNQVTTSGQPSDAGTVVVPVHVNMEALSLAINQQKAMVSKAEQNLLKLKAEGAEPRDINKTAAEVEHKKVVLQGLEDLLKEQVGSESKTNKASPTTAPTIRR